jgi:hypothetical protein
VLVTGYDINTFWVSRMLMISLWFTGEVPFHVVHNHGLVRDEHGKKMSKSFGNVIDPLDLVDTYGAMRPASPCCVRRPRRGRAAGRGVGRGHQAVRQQALERRRVHPLPAGGDRRAPGTEGDELPPAADLPLEDRWVLSRLHAAHTATDAAYDAYDWAAVCRTLFHFLWDEVADWYIEAVKLRIYGEDVAAAATARRVGRFVLEHVLRLLHPVMPFVTETLWRELTACGRWPGLVDGRGMADAGRPLARSAGRERLRRAAGPGHRAQPFPVPERHRALHAVPRGGVLAGTGAARGRGPVVSSLAGLEELRVVEALTDTPGARRSASAAARRRSRWPA